MSGEELFYVGSKPLGHLTWSAPYIEILAKIRAHAMSNQSSPGFHVSDWLVPENTDIHLM
jgi:hypothetical protein